MSHFKNKVVWVTGASSGIGEGITRLLAEKGALLILSARKLDSLEKVRASLTSKDKHLCLPLDLEDSSNFTVLVEQIIQRFGRIDILFNNGGLSQRSTVKDTPLEVDRRIMEINYFGNIALTKAVLPHMLKNRGGHIVVMSSIAGKFGFFLRSAYSSSKHALHGFYESLLLEEMDNGLKVTIACPGKINTNISVNALNESGHKHGVMDHNQATGMSVEECVEILLKAVEKNKKEVLIGNKEIKAVTLKRFLPSLFWRVIKNQSAT